MHYMEYLYAWRNFILQVEETKSSSPGYDPANPTDFPRMIYTIKFDR